MCVLPTGTQTLTASAGNPVQGPYDLTGAFPNGFGSSDGLGGWYAENIGTTAQGQNMSEGEGDHHDRLVV